MKFLMLVCRDESIEFTPRDRQNIGPQVQAWVSEMEERGVRLQGDVCADVDEAIEVSAKHPIARFGVIELRPYADV